MDQSNSVSRQQFNDMSDFIVGSLGLYKIASNETRVGISTFDVKIDEQLSVNNGKSLNTVKDALSRIQPSSRASSLDLNSVIKTVSLDMFGIESVDTKGVLILLISGNHASTSASGFDVASKDRIEALQRAGTKISFNSLTRVTSFTLPNLYWVYLLVGVHKPPIQSVI